MTLAAALLLAACGRPADPGTPVPLATGFWHAQIELPGGAIEVGFEIGKTAEQYMASLVNGQERIAVRDVSYAGGELLMRFPAYNSEIRATLVDGRLVGELELVKRYGEKQTMPFAATHGAARADPGTVAGKHDVSGRWAVQFDNDDGSTSPSIGEFAQRGSRLFGTFLNPDGDYRYLSGYVRGNDFKLSTFDGAHAFIFTGTIEADRISGGNFWSGTEWHQTWSAVRDPRVVLPDPFSRTFLKPGHERFSFAFPDLDGNTVSLDDQRFAGKVVVVMLAGTWCPNCHDEAGFMAPLYRQYRDKGLEMVALMYEHLDDTASAAAQVRLFRDKFGIEYPTLLAGISDKTLAAETLPALNAVLAFPTTIFIGRGGHVRAIHTGFSGPGTGAHYEKLTAEMTGLVTELLAEGQAAARRSSQDNGSADHAVL